MLGASTHSQRSLAMIGKGETPDDLSKEIVFTLNTVAQISGKSYPTLLDKISLLKKSDEMKVKLGSDQAPVK